MNPNVLTVCPTALTEAALAGNLICHARVGPAGRVKPSYRYGEPFNHITLLGK